MIAYTFNDPKLEEEALVHRSVQGKRSNERLEFLGDRVFNMLVATRLAVLFPSEKEDVWAERYNAVVNRTCLADLAHQWGLDKRLQTARGQQLSEKVLADVAEAYVAAIYLDSCFARVEEVLGPILDEKLCRIEYPTKDVKSTLQEMAQAHGNGIPVYTLVQKTGPDHAPHHVVSVVVGSSRAVGEGTSLKEAEKNAAASLLKAMHDAEA